MSTVVTAYGNYVKGQLDHDLNGRYDLPTYNTGMDIFTNWVSNYKGAQCGYAGSLTNCDGTYNGPNGCLVHDNGTRFGAFPGIGTNGIVLAAQQ